jgi:hypothetical protein
MKSLSFHRCKADKGQEGRIRDFPLGLMANLKRQAKAWTPYETPHGLAVARIPQEGQ